MSIPNPFPFDRAQTERLLTLRAAWEEGEDEERLARLRQREDDAETLRALQELLTDTRLENGGALSYADVSRFLALVRALASNPNLDARLLRHPNEPERFNQDLRDLLFGNASAPNRLRHFLLRRHAGGQTALQLLCAVFPQQWPLVTQAGLRLLELTPAQQQNARDIARARYELPAEVRGTETYSNQPVHVGIPDNDVVLRLLADTVVYEAARDILALPDYVSVHRLLTATRLLRRNVRSLVLPTRYTPPAHTRASVSVLREAEQFYGNEEADNTEPDANASLAAAPDIAHVATSDVLTDIERHIAAEGFTYPPLLVRDFFLSLQSKPFAIIEGVTGVGKTRLTSLFADALTGSASAQYRLLPVRPDWNDSAPLLGYVNLLAPTPDGRGQFVSTPFLDFLRRAGRPENAARTFFLCLDEMNLARVEHYFAEVLSAMETPARELLLANGQTARLPANLFLLGTLNLDGATHALSRKVGDRANTISLQEVNLREAETAEERQERDAALTQPVERQAVFLLRRASTAAMARARLKQIGGPQNDLTARVVNTLADANDILQPHSLHVAYRVRDEVLRYCANSFEFAPTAGGAAGGLLVPGAPHDLDANLRVALDFQILQKVLPRLSGAQEQIETPVRDLLAWTQVQGFTRCTSVLARLFARLQRDGFATFGAG